MGAQLTTLGRSARQWLRSRAPDKATIRTDLVAGIPGAISSVPDGMASSVLTGVPRVYEKLHTRIREAGQAAGGAKAAVFKWAISAGLERARAVLHGRAAGPITSLKTAIGERLVYAEIRKRLGGRLRFPSRSRA